MAKNRKKNGLVSPKGNPTKRVVLSAEESKKLLTRTRIRDRVRDLLSRSAIRYDKSPAAKQGKGLVPQVMAPMPQYQLNLGKRTLLMLQSWKQPRRVMIMPRQPVNRFYISILLMISLIGASGFYTYHVASRWYDDFSRHDIATAVNWEGWVRKVSGKSNAFTPSRTRDELLALEANRAANRAREEASPRPKKKIVTEKKQPIVLKEKQKTTNAKVAHKKKLSPFEEMKEWTKKRLPDVESVSVRD